MENSILDAIKVTGSGIAPVIKFDALAVSPDDRAATMRELATLSDLTGENVWAKPYEPLWYVSPQGNASLITELQFRAIEGTPVGYEIRTAGGIPFTAIHPDTALFNTAQKETLLGALAVWREGIETGNIKASALDHAPYVESVKVTGAQVKAKRTRKNGRAHAVALPDKAVNTDDANVVPVSESAQNATFLQGELVRLMESGGFTLDTVIDQWQKMGKPSASAKNRNSLAESIRKANDKAHRAMLEAVYSYMCLLHDATRAGIDLKPFIETYSTGETIAPKKARAKKANAKKADVKADVSPSVPDAKKADSTAKKAIEKKAVAPSVTESKPKRKYTRRAVKADSTAKPKRKYTRRVVSPETKKSVDQKAVAPSVTESKPKRKYTRRAVKADSSVSPSVPVSPVSSVPDVKAKIDVAMAKREAIARYSAQLAYDAAYNAAMLAMVANC